MKVTKTEYINHINKVASNKREYDNQKVNKNKRMIIIINNLLIV